MSVHRKLTMAVCTGALVLGLAACGGGTVQAVRDAARDAVDDLYQIN